MESTVFIFLDKIAKVVKTQVFLVKKLDLNEIKKELTGFQRK